MENKLNSLDLELLREVADLHKVPEGAYNIRKDGHGFGRRSTEAIQILPQEGRDGIVVNIAPGTVNQSVHIPVIIEESGLTEVVYNDFHIGANSDVLIVAGCGISNCGHQNSQHDGIHTFYVGENAQVKYVEKHYGSGDGTGERIMNPQTIFHLAPGAKVELDTAQIRGVDSTDRYTEIHVAAGGEAVVTERLLTHGKQMAQSRMEIFLEGEDAATRIISRSVAQDQSEQIFYPCVTGNAKCFGHVQCDSIIMGDSRISSIPAIKANSVDAQLIHEAAIGRIAGDQLLKLMTLGLTEAEAEERILKGFLK